MLVETKNLTKVYGDKVAVNGLNLEIEAGSFTAILGPNGAGKSTTIQMLIGLLQPTSGQITYAEQAKLGVVFQNSVLDANLTVVENLQIRAKQYKQVATGKIEKLIEQLGLTSFAKQRYGTLSGGQKRRVDIARALLNSPDLLFLDEPTTGLDIQTRESIWKLLKELQQKEKMTVVLTTHYLNEADDADKIYIVDHGQVIAQGSADQIKERYARNVLRILTQHSESLKAALPTSCEFEQGKENEFFFYPETTQEALTLLSQLGSYIEQFEFQAGTMDDAFMALTGREVR
ncbi:multidrig ABC transporter ATPase [Streptococcus cristatus]|uniref:ABC transporter ATP-binding protein n=2 Tax=Streptococcus cristatus TaxID=45634 RepID=A0A512ABN3_STRCR|nr:ABC transporter ATP-binding protein [Streptococcus cristatus]AGK71717.1 multidrig ABC transporter ATPase [Streptococcus cristatus AS 1.3089]GEN97087.1 ABC transporter ATP-binding protein [Streptococcus cristatus]SQI48606.1 multidrig ABC transporter ATPase [Streptococcus cristatus]